MTVSPSPGSKPALAHLPERPVGAGTPGYLATPLFSVSLPQEGGRKFDRDYLPVVPECRPLDYSGGGGVGSSSLTRSHCAGSTPGAG
jgi:hypothetical protein